MSDDSTRVMPAVSERTMVAGADPNSTQQLNADPMRTQMGAVTTCPVCKTTVPALEKYCTDCGYLLEAGAPSEPDFAVVGSPAAPAQLTDASDGRIYALRLGVNTIGRQGSDIITAEGTVSRIHARITVQDGSVTLEDLGSSNGTRVENVKLTQGDPVEVTDGANLRFGNWKVILRILETKTSAEATIAIPASATEPMEPEQPVEAPPPSQPAPVADPVAVLRWTEGPGVDILIPTGTLTLGRRPENSVVLTGDQYVSGRHASITADDNHLIITDDGSRNGTFVNGERLQEHQPTELAAGDTIKVGQTTYQLSFIPSNTSPQETIAPYE